MISEETIEKYFDFLDEYSELCMKYGCLIAALDFQKEAVTGIEEGISFGITKKQATERIEDSLDQLYDDLYERTQNDGE